MPTADAGPAPSGEFTGEAERSSQVSDFPCTAIPVKRLTIKTYVMLLLMMTFGTVGNVLLDRGMKNLSVIDLSSSLAIWKGVETVFVSGTIWVGIAFLLLYMLCNMLVLSWADYSFVMPFTAVSYVGVALTGYLWLRESVSVARWLGIGLIMAGVFLISRTPENTTKGRTESATETLVASAD